MIRRVYLALAGLLLIVSTPFARAQDAQPIYLVVRVPAEAVVEIDGQRTSRTGAERRFVSPALAAGTYYYHIRATWTDQGRKMVADKYVSAQTGQDTVVDLRNAGMVDGPPPMTEPKAPAVVKKEAPVTVPAVKKDPPPTIPSVVKKEAPPPVKETPMKPEVVKKEAATPPAKVPAAAPGQILVAFVETPPDVVEKMLSMADITKDDVVYDLGCGDGRIPIHAAQKHGARGVGIELDKDLVARAQSNVKKHKVETLVEIIEGDLLQADVSPATIVALYLLPDINDQIAPMLQKQLKPGARVVSHDFPISKWKLDRKLDLTDKDGTEHTLYLYKVDAQK